MKIAMIGQKGIPAIYGGIEKHVEELSLRLASYDNEVTVYTRPHYTAKSKKNLRGIQLKSVPSVRTKHFDAISHTLLCSIHALFKNYDIIHYHGVGPSLLCFIPRIFKPRTKVVATFHCIDRHHQKWGKMARGMLWLGERAACIFAHEVITVSKTLRMYCYEVFACQTKYIPNGISEMTYHKPSIIKQQFGLEGNDYILMVARLIPHKGIHYMIDAYKRLNTDKKLVIVGDSYFTDDYVVQLKKQAAGDSNIIFTGFQTGQALEELFGNAYLFVHPSETEGLPIAVLEAAAYGLCVLASDIPANMEIVRECGLSFSNKDVDDLTDKLQSLLKNEDVVKQTGKHARTHVLENYNWIDISKKTNELYKKLASGNASLIIESLKAVRS